MGYSIGIVRKGESFIQRLASKNANLKIHRLGVLQYIARICWKITYCTVKSIISFHQKLISIAK